MCLCICNSNKYRRYTHPDWATVDWAWADDRREFAHSLLVVSLNGLNLSLSLSINLSLNLSLNQSLNLSLNLNQSLSLNLSLSLA